jgi:hypothetical protein
LVVTLLLPTPPLPLLMSSGRVLLPGSLNGTALPSAWPCAWPWAAVAAAAVELGAQHFALLVGHHREVER